MNEEQETQEPELCYLCGEAVLGDVSRDHVPPKQIFSREVRRNHSPELLTLPTHKLCNLSYQQDEEYFIHTLSPVVMDSYSGQSLHQELLQQYAIGRNVPLSRAVLNEFERRPSGIYLPNGKIAKRFDPDRFWRVVWKIIRGLFFLEYGRYLPEDTLRTFKLVSPGNKPPDEFYFLNNEPFRGRHPGVFDYKYRQFPEVHDCHLWAMLFWDRLIVLSVFHDPEDNGSSSVQPPLSSSG